MLQNLLLKEYKKRLTREYYLRLFVVGTFALSVSVFIGICALFPVYINVHNELRQVTAEHNLKQKEDHSNKEIAEELVRGVHMIDLLKESREKEKFTHLIDEVLAVRPEGVRIIGVSYDRENMRLNLEGVAETRDDPVPYSKAVEANQLFEEAEVPISDLGRGSNLVFDLNILLAESVQSSQ